MSPQIGDLVRYVGLVPRESKGTLVASMKWAKDNDCIVLATNGQDCILYPIKDFPEWEDWPRADWSCPKNYLKIVAKVSYVSVSA